MSTTFKTNVQDATINNTLTVDTNTLHVDPTNNGVCIGTTTLTSGNKLTVNGKADFADVLGLAKIATGSLPSAASYEGYIVYDDTLNKFVYSNGSSWVDPTASGSMTIGGTVTSGTTGSILFIGSGPVLAQDNAKLFWDDSNDRLGIGTASPASPLDILPVTVLAQSSGYVSGITLGGTFTRNTAGAVTYAVQQIKPTFNFGGSNTLTTVNVLSVDTINTSTTGLTACNLLKLSYGGTQMGAVDNTGLFITNGVRTVIEGVATWKDSGGSKAIATGMKVPGGSITDDFILSTWSGSAWTERMRVANSSGLATFANAVTVTGALTVDTDTLYTDTTNNRIGIGTTSPGRSLSVIASVTGNGMIEAKNTHTAGYSSITARDSGGTKYVSIGWGNASVGSAPYAGTGFVDFSDTLKFINTTPAVVATLAQTGVLTISPTAVTTAADQFVSGLSIGGSFTKNDGNTRQFYVQQIKPTFNLGGSNLATTVDILNIDSTNTSVTGTTVNLINAQYGGTSKFKVDSSGSVTLSAPIVYKGETGITALAGGGQGSATALTAEVSFVTTVATTGDSVKLPTAALGKHMVVYNDGANSVNIFPISGGQIDALGTNNAYALAAGNSIEFWGKSATDWKSR